MNYTIKLVLSLLVVHNATQLGAGNCCGCIVRNSQTAHYTRIPESEPMQEDVQRDQQIQRLIPVAARAKVIRKGPEIGNPTNLPVAVPVSGRMPIMHHEVINSYQIDIRARFLFVERRSNQQIVVVSAYMNGAMQYYVLHNPNFR